MRALMLCVTCYAGKRYAPCYALQLATCCYVEDIVVDAARFRFSLLLLC